MTDAQRNAFVGVLLFVFAAVLAGFLTALIGSNSGEAAGALGGILGGIIGAAGATFSVYYLLTRQSAEETENITLAIFEELAVIAKYVIGNLALCELVVMGEQIPRSRLRNLIVTPEPVVYRAAADKIARLRRPAAVVNFYTRLAEDDAIISQIEHAPTGGDIIQKEELGQIADLYVKQCIEVRRLLLEANDGNSEQKPGSIRAEMIDILRGQIDAAQVYFPNIESFGK